MTCRNRSTCGSIHGEVEEAQSVFPYFGFWQGTFKDNTDELTSGSGNDGEAWLIFPNQEVEPNGHAGVDSVTSG